MQVDVRHSPSFAIARCVLAGGESMRAEAGSMALHSTGISIEAKMQGGLMKSLARGVLGGESFFVTTYTADRQGGWVDVAPNLPGDVVSVELAEGQGLSITRGCYLASSGSVQIDTKWAGFKSMFGGEGGFVIRATGPGLVLASCYGALDSIQLADGETVVVDAGHLVTYDDGMRMELKRVGGSTMTALKSSEGLVFEITGPGRVTTQTRNPRALIDWIAASIPGTRQ